ncbi:predicted protein [Chaetoceros tenuissimus]|uniref:Uncharacterized protein n=1 Tax=Chaetoceros tenuissimus TaxID=426638 RepID=A0AAD3D7I2_9STRA|nr:predicted protein [Chaetoceros tenuissimus]
MILDKKLIWLLISILSYGVAKETKRDLWYINPCTGSISNDAPTDDEIQDCVTATPTKTVQPSSAPTQEQNPLNPDNDKKLCPGSEDCSIDVESDTVVPVMFKYSVETQPGADINALLPELEENILFKLAPSTLDHCLTDEAARTRHLEGSTAPTGICSRPADFQLTAESCDPEKSESNDCFVIMGGLSVAVESGADDAAKDAVKDQILDATKSLMENDELLGSNVAPVEKVKFLGEYPPTDKVLCPGSEDCSIDVESDTVVPVMFKYSVETQPGADINALLPELEENLLFKLAPSTLDHCLTDEAARTRHLEGSTAPTGICSRPADFQLTAESCDPEKSESNDCFVIMGGLSVAVESGADDAAKDAVKDQILDATKSLMENDELLGSNVAPVESGSSLGSIHQLTKYYVQDQKIVASMLKAILLFQ